LLLLLFFFSFQNFYYATHLKAFELNELNENERPTDSLGLSAVSQPLFLSKVPTKAQNDNKFYNFTELVRLYDLSKVYQSPISPLDHSWCTQKYNYDRPTGLLYNKLPKAASSTTAGIAIRIAHMVSSRLYGNGTVCSIKCGHLAGLNEAGKRYSKRDRLKSFLFSTLRDPGKRSISRIFFSNKKEIVKAIEKNGDRGRDDKIRKILLKAPIEHQFGIIDPKRGGFQLAYTIMNVSEDVSVYDPNHPTEISDPDFVASMVRKTMEDYDFMIIVERFDECIVVMQLLLGLEPSDMMYLSAKKAGEYYNKNGKCSKIMKSFVSPRVLEAISSESWYTKNYGDYLLIEAASQSLDLTIESIGRDRFEEAFQVFQNWKKRAQGQCDDKAIFPCSATGHLQKEKSNCYQKDRGCGYPCLDAMKPQAQE